MTEYTFKPIGRITSCFTQKFGIPRQPGLVPEARADLDVLPPYHRYEAFKGLEAFSHIWILFVFHGLHAGRWKTTVRPPRLGGNQRLGVFATRSGFRPNPAHIDGYLTVSDEDVIAMARRLAREEGIFAGFSAGANAAAAIQLLKGPMKGKTVAILLSDSGLKYLSTDLWGKTI